MEVDSSKKFPFETWKEKNHWMIEELYGILLESCRKHDLKIYAGDDFYREFVYYLYHHAYNASCDPVLIQCPEDQASLLEEN